MRRKRFGFTNLREMNNDNRGFTLVELLVCIGILAAVAIPLVQSFSAASISNSKAQAIQDATSLAEDVMEEVKSSTIDELVTKYSGGTINTLSVTEAAFWALSEKDRASLFTASGTGMYADSATKPKFLVLFLDEQTSTQGDEYDVVVSLSTDKYKYKASLTPTETADASDANGFKLPRINEVDTGRQVALSKELTKYDNSAAGNIQTIYSAGGASAPSTTKTDIATNGTKSIIVTMVNAGPAGDPTSKVAVNCSVRYEDATNPSKYFVQYNVYSGTFAADEKGFAQPNIYLFYNQMDVPVASPDDFNFTNEKIIVTDDTTGVYPAGYLDPVTGENLAGKLIRHDVYLVMQGADKTIGTTGTKGLKSISMSRGGSTVSMNSLSTGCYYETNDAGTGVDVIDDRSSMQITNQYGNRMFSNLDVGGALTTSEYDRYGKLYQRKEKDKIYQIDISLTKDTTNKVYATLESTRYTDITPTPTPP